MSNSDCSGAQILWLKHLKCNFPTYEMKLEINLRYLNKSMNDNPMINFKGHYDSLTRAMFHLYLYIFIYPFIHIYIYIYIYIFIQPFAHRIAFI